MKVFVTGACGYKGTVLVPKLLAAGHEVIAFDIMWFGNFLKPHARLSVVKGDVRNIDEINLDGVDAIVWTAGMGENNTELRERACSGLEFFGVKINTELNAKIHHQPNTVEISTADSKVKVYVLPTNEELMIASDTEDIVKNLNK
jgi:UDP-glucose 4-epimerase